ncbi:hypothetical protein Ddc_15436 [Ditylenchus destructor]|nr:hypothetical protein Ddc_15436 [Ditylenchus destructor]
MELVLLKTSFSHTAVPNSLLATVLDTLSAFITFRFTFFKHYYRIFHHFLSISVILAAHNSAVIALSSGLWPAYVPDTDNALFCPPEKAFGPGHWDDRSAPLSSETGWHIIFLHTLSLSLPPSALSNLGPRHTLSPRSSLCLCFCLASVVSVCSHFSAKSFRLPYDFPYRRNFSGMKIRTDLF